MRSFLSVSVLIAIGIVGCFSAESASEMEFEIQLAQSAFDEIAALGLDTPVSGRLFLVVSRSDEREPRLQTGVSGVPFWGMDVEGIGPGDVLTLNTGDSGVTGFPLDSLSELPEDEYFVQALLSVYTNFERSDGHTVSMHLNSGAGQNQWRAPGNAISSVTKLNLKPASGRNYELTLNSVIPPLNPLEEGDVLQQGNPSDTELVKFVKIQSDLLSEFWGRPMYIGANVLLPVDYDTSDQSYPVMYMQGHFPGGRAPLGFSTAEQGRGRSAGLSEFWLSDEAPRMIAISIRDANPYYDTSYSVDSDNVGPYGAAITNELIPYLESQFRIIDDSWARIVAGGSTGGWEALAMQIYYPDTFGGSWGWCPDPVDFNYHQIVNVYEDDNAYFLDNEWHRVERPNARRFDGNIRSTVRQENLLELATGPNTRSGGQWAIWEAVFGPVGSNGYPQPIWDPESGEINRATADYWRGNADLHDYLRTNWESVASQLDGKLHIAVGDMDSYYLDNAVYRLDEFLNQEAQPRIETEIQYGRRKPHCWTGYSPNNPGEDMSTLEFVQIVADHFSDNAPNGAEMDWINR